MASTVDSKPTEQYVDFEEYVDFQLKKARQQIRATDLLTAGTVAAVMVVGYLLAFVIADQRLFTGGLPAAWRWTGLLIWIAALCGWLVWKFGVPLMKSVTGLFAARQVERAEPELHSNLLNWVDLQRAGRPVDPAVLRAIERQAAVQLSKIDVNQAVDHRPLLQSGYALLTVMVLFCLYAVLSPKKLTPSLWRVLPVADVAVPTRTEIRSVTPGDADVLARSPLEVTVELGGDIPKQVRLVYTTTDQKFRDEPVMLQPDGEAGTRFRTILAGESGQGLLRDLTYRIEAGDAVSSEYRVTVAQPPSARVEQLQIAPPEYTRLPQETIAGGQFTAWEGSRVALSATVNLPVRSAKLQFLDEPTGVPTGEEVAVKVQDGTKLSADWKLVLDSKGKHSPYYRIQCETADGRTDPAPLVYQHTILRDQPPELVLLAPERDLTVPANAVIPLLAEARDPDFELGPVALQVNKGNESLNRETLFPGKQKAVRIEHDLALKPFQLKPGDEITFHLEAQDNRLPTRNRTATSPIRIRIEAPTEDRKVQEQLAQEKARQRDQLAELDRKNADRDPMPAGDAPMGDPEAPREPRPMNDEPRDATGEQPKPRDNAEEGTSKASSKPGEGGEKTSSSQTGGEQGEKGSESEPSKLSPDGQDDQELLQKLLERYEAEGQKPGEKTSKSNGQPQPRDQTGARPTENPDDGNPPPEGTSPDERNPSPNGAQKPNPSGQKPTDAAQPGPSESGPKEPMPGDTGANDTAKPNGPGNNPGQPKPPATRDQRPMPGQPNGPGESTDAADGPKNDRGDKPSPTESGKPKNASNNERPNAASKTNDAGQPNGDQPKGNDQPQESGNKPTESTKPMGAEGGQPGKTSSGRGETRSSDDKSPTQPGQTGSQSTERSATKPSGPMKGDPPTTGTSPQPSPDKQPTTGQPQPRDGAPEGGEQLPKGAGRPNPQRSEQPQNGEGGGSQQAQDGSPGSKQRGPGESTGRPGEQEAGSSNPSQGGKKASSQTGGKPTGNQQGGQQQGGQQQEGNQQGSGQQPGGQQQTGQQEGGQKEGSQQQGSQQQSGQQQSGQQQGSQQQGGGQKQGSQQQGSQQQGGQQQGGQQQGGQQQGGQQQGGQQQGGQQQGGQQQGGQQQGGQQEGGQQGGKQPGGSPSSGQSVGSPSGEPSGQGGVGGMEQLHSGGNSGGDNAPAGDPANLEFKKQAAELVLQRLKDGLDRGDVDPKLLEELGWTPDEMQRFVNRLSQSLHNADDTESPEAIARRVQFEEMLRSLSLNRAGAKRVAGKQPSREVDQIESRRAPVPGEYRKAWERYTQQLSKQPPSAAKKP